MSRSEHLAWAKKRALEYVERGDGVQAMASMISDLGKHPELASSGELGAMLMFATDAKDMHAVRYFIEGFN